MDSYRLQPLLKHFVELGKGEYSSEDVEEVAFLFLIKKYRAKHVAVAALKKDRPSCKKYAENLKNRFIEIDSEISNSLFEGRGRSFGEGPDPTEKENYEWIVWV